MLWLSVHLPHLALDGPCESAAESSASEAAARPPRVVSERCGSGMRILDADAAAGSRGIAPGMDLAAAFALAPGLRVLEHDHTLEVAALERLASWALQFTSQVALTPTGLLLEIGGSLRLLGGLSTLLRRVRRGLAALRYHHVLGVAPTPRAAQWLARYQALGPDAASAEEAEPWHGGTCCCRHLAELPSRLAPLPLAVMALTDPQAEALAAMGITRLDALMALPAASLGRRFGPTLLRELEQARGRLPDPRPAFRPPVHFEATLALPADITQQEALRFPLRRLLLELEGFLRGRDRVVQRLQLQLAGRLPGQSQSLTLALLTPLQEAGALSALLQPRLERLRLEAPVACLTLRARELLPATPRAGELLAEAAPAATAAQDAPLLALLERLRARLGDDAVMGLARQADHRPERAWRWQEPAASPAAMVEIDPAWPLSSPRPLWLLAEPWPLGTDAAGLPRHAGAALHLFGGERLESGWWDGEDYRRDYYLAVTAAGERLWIYRELRGGAWFCHGLFA